MAHFLWFQFQSYWKLTPGIAITRTCWSSLDLSIRVCSIWMFSHFIPFIWGEKLQRLKDTLWYEQYEHQQSQFGMFNRGWWCPFSIMCAVWSTSPWLCLTVLLASKACPCIPCAFCARGIKKSQPPASILDIGQVTYAKSHSDWMIEGPFALAAAGFVPACGFAKPAGRFLCLGFSYTTRPDCWRSV